MRALSRNGGLWTNPEILNVTFHNYTRAYVTSDYRLRRLLPLRLIHFRPRGDQVGLSSLVREPSLPTPFKLLSLLWRAWQLGAQLSLHLSDEGIVGDRLARLILLNRLHVGHELLR